MYFFFTGLKQFLHHVTGSTIPKERSVKVDFMVDPNGCMAYEIHDVMRVVNFIVTL